MYNEVPTNKLIMDERLFTSFWELFQMWVRFFVGSSDLSSLNGLRNLYLSSAMQELELFSERF